MLSKAISTCRLCDSPQLEEIFDLGEHALSGRFPLPEDPDVPSGPLRLVKCGRCDLVQLGHDFELRELFGETYGYRSGINATMANHLAGVARAAESLIELGDGDVVLDIASNDGTLLKSYGTNASIVKIGIDPTIRQYRSHYPVDTLAEADFFSAATFRRVSTSDCAKIVTSIAVLYDLPDPHSFVRDVAEVLDPEGLWILEQADIGSILQSNAFDAICHEHLEYYGTRQLQRLLGAHGLRIFDIQFNHSNGGSSRIFACHETAPFTPNKLALAGSDARDSDLALTDMATYQRFSERVVQLREKLCAFLRDVHDAGALVHIYGASTKGNTLLQYCGIDDSIIAAASERNPVKWGRRTPGTNIPIISEEESRASSPDYLLVLPWHFREEFIDRECDYINSGGHLVFPLPEFSVYPN